MTEKGGTPNAITWTVLEFTLAMNQSYKPDTLFFNLTQRLFQCFFREKWSGEIGLTKLNLKLFLNPADP